MHSITETLKKINIDLRGLPFYSISISLVLSSFFVLFKIYETDILNKNAKIVYTNSFQNHEREIENNAYLESDLEADLNSEKSKFIYASKYGQKYYFYNCKSSIREENKIYFETEEEAKLSDLDLASSCK